MSEQGEAVRKKLYDLFNGEEGAAIIYGRVMTVLIILSLVPLCLRDVPIWLLALEWVCVVVFIVDYACRWVTADFKLGKKALSFLLYPFTPMAIVDLLSILPAFIALNSAWRTLRVLRLFRVLRAFKLVRYSKGVNAIGSALRKEKNALGVVLALTIGYVLVSALVIFNVEPETFPSFFDAIYWSVISLTTVGYGDLYPSSDIGRVVAMLSSFAGIAIVALPASIITAGLLEEFSETKQSADNEH